MNSPYQYCSRCGDELNDGVREHYEANHNSGPVLCVPCVREVVQGIPKALQSVLEAFSDAFEEAFSPFIADDDAATNRTITPPRAYSCV